MADGLFHLVTMVFLFVGTIMLWRRVHQDGVVWSGRQLFGLTLIGWGLFDLIEGVVDHQILGVHHVHTGPDQFFYDMGFLALGALLVVVGHLFARSPRVDDVRVDPDQGAVRSEGIRTRT